MSWFSSKTATPARTTIRQQEVGILQRTMRDLNWITPDETCLKVIPVGSIHLTLSIHVPQDYPQQPPVLRILTPAQHQWLDNQGFMTLCPAIANWNPNSPSLVSLIQFIEAKFRESPPIPQQTNTYQPPSQQQQQQGQSTASGNQQSGQYNSLYSPSHQSGGGQGNSGGYNPGQSFATNQSFSSNSQQQQQQQQSSFSSNPYNPQQSMSNNTGSYGQPPILNQTNSYLPPQGPMSPNRPSFGNGSYTNSQYGQGGTPLSPTSEQQQTRPHTPSASVTMKRPVPQPEEKNGLKYASQGLVRPSTPTLASSSQFDVQIQLATIPPEPSIDRALIQRMPITKLDELDGSGDKIKEQIGQNAVINHMYESILTEGFAVSELQGQYDKIQPKIQPLEIELAEKKASVISKEAQLANLKKLYQEKVKEFDIETYINELQEQLYELDDRGEELAKKISTTRKVDEEMLADFLEQYEQIRQEYHLKMVVLKNVKN